MHAKAITVAADNGPRIWSHIDRRGPDECWPWTGHTVEGGYGRVCVDGVMRLAHRAVEALIRGPIPTELQVLHSCDNPPCCNPRHLFRGTQVDNMADMAAKGRRRHGDVRGERHGGARLTEADVRAIRQRVGAGETLAALSRTYGVSGSMVSLIVQRRRWRHVV